MEGERKNNLFFAEEVSPRVSVQHLLEIDLPSSLCPSPEIPMDLPEILKSLDPLFLDDYDWISSFSSNIFVHKTRWPERRLAALKGQI